MTRRWDLHFAALVLLIAGLALWNRFAISSRAIALTVLAAIVALWLVPKSQKPDSSILRRVDDFLNRHRKAVATAIAILIIAHLLLCAWLFRSDLFVKFHDEHVYLIQAHMLAHGHLWLPPFPPQVVEFFDSFYIIMDRVYAGMYPPGTAILLLPIALFSLPHWFMPAAASAGAVIFFFLILSEIFGPTKAIVGILLLLSSKAFASMSFMVLSEAPFLLASLVAFWSWLRWRSNKKSAWLVLLGVAAGFGAITRPADMFCTAAAIAIAMLIERRRELKLLNKSAGIICLAATPFLAIQIIQNAGITGKSFESPIRYYTDENYPSPILSFREVTAKDVPATNCLPKQIAMKQWILPETEQHWRLSLWQIWYPKRFIELFDQTLSRPLLLIILPASLLALWEIRRLTIVGAALLFCIIYTADTVFLPHYFLAITPAVICLILCALETIERTFHRGISTAVTITAILIAICAFPELKGSISASPSPSYEERTINQTLATLPARPALVLFHFDPKVNSFHTEPVYNDTVAWPDDAQIVRARDLGADENSRLYRYYRDDGQNRDVYRYDRAAPAGQNPMTRLGTIAELAH